MKKFRHGCPRIMSRSANQILALIGYRQLARREKRSRVSIKFESSRSRFQSNSLDSTIAFIHDIDPQDDSRRNLIVKRLESAKSQLAAIWEAIAS